MNPKHRNQPAGPACTQWTISVWEELRLFSVAKENEWVCAKNSLWAIEKIDNVIRPLGTTGQDIAYIAKYVTDHNHEWHGYPVTPSRQADRPPTVILDNWERRGIITRHQQGHIVKGQF